MKKFTCTIDLEHANFGGKPDHGASMAVSKIGSAIFSGKREGIVRDDSGKRIGSWKVEE